MSTPPRSALQAAASAAESAWLADFCSDVKFQVMLDTSRALEAIGPDLVTLSPTLLDGIMSRSVFGTEDRRRAAHTPTPWGLAYNGDIWKQSDLDNPKLQFAKRIATSYGTPEQSKIDAEFIVRACNSHDDLVKAVNMLLGNGDYYFASWGSRKEFAESILNRTALAAAN